MVALTHGMPPLSLAEHYADDLEVDIDEIMGNDFNVELEDDSPRMVMSYMTRPRCVLRLVSECMLCSKQWGLLCDARVHTLLLYQARVGA